MTLDHTKDTQKMYMYPDKITFRGHTYVYFGAEWNSYARAETEAKKLRKEGISVTIKTTKRGLVGSVYGIYIRGKK